MISANNKVTALAMMMGRLLSVMPKTSQSNVPKENNEYIPSEMPEVSFVRIVLTACGTNEAVVQTAAINPMMVTIFNYIICGVKTY